MNLNDLLSKVDEYTLLQLLGSVTFKLLQLLDSNLIHDSKLKETILTVYTPEQLLLSQEKRNLLLNFVTPEQAKILATVLKAPKHQDPYQALKKVKISEGSEAQKYLFNFFEIPLSSRSPNTVETPTIIEITPQYPLFPHQRHAAQQVKTILVKNLVVSFFIFLQEQVRHAQR